MSIKTVSIETAKLLKEAGFPQRTGMVWRKYQGWICEPIENDYAEKGWYSVEIEEKAAPTTDELLEELPYDQITIAHNRDGFYVGCYKTGKIDPCDSGEFMIGFRNILLSEALARMFLHLKQQNLLENKEGK